MFSLLLFGIITILFLNGNVHYGENPVRKNWQNEGPYIFFENDSTLSINHISGNKEEGIKKRVHPKMNPFSKTLLSFSTTS
ncbi:MAG: hypothetical protein ACI9XB_000290 [Gammaproteobacteria bacterium]|jgi:hypothetical protein